MSINDRIQALRQLMKENNIDVYIVPSADNHQSEYTGDYFRTRAFITGFTGSAGTAIITQTEAGLWTDGRYFIQAEAQLKGSEVTLYKMGNPGVPTIDEFLDRVLENGATLGFDGRVISMSEGLHYSKKFADKNIKIQDKFDLIDEIWEDRPAMSDAPLFYLEEKYTGESTASKLNRIRNFMKANGASVHLLITLDDIAWLLNMRGRDVQFTPVFLSYAAITMEAVHLFIDERKVSDELKDILAKDNVVLHPYNDIYSFTAALPNSESVLLDSARLNFALYNSIPEGAKIVDKMNPCVLYKAMKNDVEVENIKKAHVKDAVAHVKFNYWLKNNFDKEIITELSAAAKLESFRAEQENFLWPSFSPICAYGAHAAMCHYSPSKESDCALEPGTFFLTDTGGNYMEGSTDITRTLALGEISDELKFHYTNVLRGNLALSKAKFLYGCTGQNLDILARQYLWNVGLDYNHGTGHGVGYLLSIHEAPCRIRWQQGFETIPLSHGMILSDEPGLYIEGSHGIRHENEILVRNGVKNMYGQFMEFEVITYVPFDLDAIDPTLMRDDEKAQLNEYHKLVYDIVSPHLTDDEREWLKVYTRAI